MSSRHTDGPWFHRVRLDGKHVVTAKEHAGDDWVPVATMADNGRESEANAILTAAAPYMLAALKFVLPDCNSGYAHDAVLDAIRAATGRAPDPDEIKANAASVFREIKQRKVECDE